MCQLCPSWLWAPCVQSCPWGGSGSLESVAAWGIAALRTLGLRFSGRQPGPLLSGEIESLCVVHSHKMRQRLLNSLPVLGSCFCGCFVFGVCFLSWQVLLANSL